MVPIKAEEMDQWSDIKKEDEQLEKKTIKKQIYAHLIHPFQPS